RDTEKGKKPRFNEFMQKYAHFFPPGIENLDQLMEHLQTQMQRMENMLNSMSTQQRAELENAMQSLMQDPGLMEEMAELAAHLGQTPGMGRQYRFSGDPDESLSMSEAMQVMEQLDELEKLERELNAARRGDNIDELNTDKVGNLLGPDAHQ